MQTRLFTSFALFALVLAVCGADEKLATLTVGSQTYSNVTVTKVTATDIHFFHAHGIGSAKLKSLDPELQKHFHFDAGAAEVAEQKPAVNTAAAPLAGPDDIKVDKLYAKSFLHQRAPSFVVEKWLTPEPKTEGKFILIDFWATWCGPCKKAIPHMNELYAKYKDQVVFVGLSDESEGAVRQLAEPHMDYSVAIDPQHRMAQEIQIQGIPHAMLIDPHGYVRFEGMPFYLNEQNLGKLLARYSK